MADYRGVDDDEQEKWMIRIEKDTPIVVLTGAGISKESGLDTFRDADGIWSKVRIEDVATPEAFARDPVRVHEFYNARRRGVLGENIAPNAAHKALALLEREWPGGVLIVTQNIDNLHERGRSQNIIHMHGELLKSICNGCGIVTVCMNDLSISSVCSACDAEGMLRPQVVWFGEMPLDMERIEEALSNAGLFLSIGTSGNVYPAAGFVDAVRRLGQGHTVELNLEPSSGATMFAQSIYGEATVIVPDYVEALLASR